MERGRLLVSEYGEPAESRGAVCPVVCGCVQCASHPGAQWLCLDSLSRGWAVGYSSSLLCALCLLSSCYEHMGPYLGEGRWDSQVGWCWEVCRADRHCLPGRCPQLPLYGQLGPQSPPAFPACVLQSYEESLHLVPISSIQIPSLLERNAAFVI